MKQCLSSLKWKINCLRPVKIIKPCYKVQSCYHRRRHGRRQLCRCHRRRHRRRRLRRRQRRRQRRQLYVALNFQNSSSWLVFFLSLLEARVTFRPTSENSKMSFLAPFYLTCIIVLIKSFLTV